MELNRFRWEMQQIGYSEDLVNDMIQLASQELNEAIVVLVENALAASIDYAADLGAHEFLDDVEIRSNGYSYEIATISGKTDYSTPGRQRKQELLKDAKVSKDGNRYKVIPMEDKSKKQKMLSSFSVDKTRQRMIDSTRAALREKQGLGSTQSSKDMIEAFRKSFNAQRGTSKNYYASQRAQLKSKATDEVRFRTVSEKQPDDAWALPDINKDMTIFLYDLNDKLEKDFDAVVKNIIDGYIDEFGVY